jgi:hypothetical protein
VRKDHRDGTLCPDALGRFGAVDVPADLNVHQDEIRPLLETFAMASRPVSTTPHTTHAPAE